MLSILYITKCEPHAKEFIEDGIRLAHILGAEIVLACDADSAPWMFDNTFLVKSDGYLESVLDEAVSHCNGDYILRLDDDELASPAMIEWLRSDKYKESDSWQFPRMHLYSDRDHYITNPPLWTDPQTRLSIKEKSGSRTEIHVGSPWPGKTAPVAIEHHKFLVKLYAERQEIAKNYERIRPGAGLSDTFKPFSLPEDCFSEIKLAQVGDGSV